MKIIEKTGTTKNNQTARLATDLKSTGRPTSRLRERIRVRNRFSRNDIPVVIGTGSTYSF